MTIEDRAFAVADSDVMLKQAGMPTYTELREELRKAQANYAQTGRDILHASRAPAEAIQAWVDTCVAGELLILRATP